MCLESRRIKRAQPKGAVGVDGYDGGPVGEGVHQRREIVGRGARRVQRQGALDRAERHFVFLGQNNDDPSGHGERGRVIGVAGDRLARVDQRGALVRLVKSAAGEAPLAAPGEMRMRSAVVRIQTERLFQQRDGDSGPVRHSRLHIWQSAQKEIVGVEIFGTFPPRAFDLRAPQARLDDADHAIGTPSSRATIAAGKRRAL